MQDADRETFASLIHLLTGRQTSDGTTVGLKANNTLLPIVGSIYYKRCFARFQNTTFLRKNKAWEKHIRDIYEDARDNHYAYNTCPYIYELLGQELINGKGIPVTDQTLIWYCYYYDWVLGNRDEVRNVFRRSV